VFAAAHYGAEAHSVRKRPAGTLPCSVEATRLHGYWVGRPAILHHETKVFFCKYNDPIYVKMEKLEVCTACNVQRPTHPPKDGRARAALSVNQHMHTRTLAQAQP